MLKSFLEVLNTIKPGETYISVNEESRLKEINYNNIGDHIEFIGTVDTIIAPTFFGINPHRKIFKLKREKYNFCEAYIAYKEGKIIESLESQCCYKKDGLIKKEWNIMSPEKQYDSTSFSMDEIDGKWHIYENED